MKKCLAIILTFVFLLGTWTVPVFAGEISSVTAEIDSNKLVTVKGIISTGAGQVVNIKITDPKGQLEYADSIISYGAGSFQASYTMINNEAGKYNVLVNALGASSALASFSYGTDNTLKGLSISKGVFDKAFSPETTRYAVNVDSRVDSITVTPTVNDSTATVKVNGTAVTSGAPSGGIVLKEGDNTVDIAVTSLSGETNTYTITITKWGVLSSGLTAEASIDEEKNVTVSGAISSGPGQAVTLKITDPGGNPEYAGNIISTAGGQFSFTYKLSNTINGRYTAALGGIGISTPVTTYFDYFDMQSITVSGITLKPGFQKDVTAYTAIAQGSVGSITVTPTAGGSNANISINSVKVASGTASGPITLQSGANIVSVVLHGQDGVSSKTYTITVARDMEFVESGTVAAIISDDKLVDITGTIGADPGRQVTVLVRDPKGNVDYLGTSATTEGGAFKISYPLTNEEQGEYSVNVGSKDLLGTLSASFTYLLDSADLSGLEISNGSLSPAFAKDTTSYRAQVDHAISKIKVTPYAVDPLATIEVNGSKVKSGKDSGYISLKEGSNTISIVVTAFSGKEKTYKIIVTKKSPPKSSNAYLSGLTVSPGSLDTAFGANITYYTVNVGNDVTTITVTPTVWDAKATVTVNGAPVASGSASNAVDLKTGLNYAYVEVTAQNGNKITYTLGVIRAGSGNANLSALSVSAGTLSPAFSESTTNYTVNVANSVSSITAGIVTADEKATFTVNGIYGYDNDTPFTLYNLGVGSNVIRIDVKAENGVTVKTYTITVNRLSSDHAALSNITLHSSAYGASDITGFDPAITGYIVNVPNDVASIKIRPDTNDAATQIKVNGANVVPGGLTDWIDLSVGNNTISILVTAPNGINTKTYTLTIKREYNVNLGSIQLSSPIYPGGIILSPSFAVNTQSYTASLAYEATSVTVTAYKHGPEAVIRINGEIVASGSPSEAIGLNLGANPITVTVTAPDGTSKTYTVTVTRLPVNNANLSSLTVSAGNLSPVFDTETINYVVEAPPHTENITVTPVAADPEATMTVKRNGTSITGNGGAYTAELSFGTNWIVITVTARNGITSKTYNIRVERLYSNDGTLSSLTVSSGSLNPPFNPSVTSYAINVSNSVSSITVTPTANDSYYRSMTVDGTAITSGSPSSPISLTVGSKTITIRVAPQVGSYNYYYLTVTRAPSANADLSSLSVSGGTLNPAFSAATTNYTVSVGNGTTSVTVTPAAAENGAAVTVSGAAVSSGSASSPISLSVGSNTIPVVVTAPNGTTIKTYTITVTRAPSANADLSGLSISGGTLDPAFSAATTSYTVSVGNGITSVTVTPTAADNGAAVTVSGAAVSSGSASSPISLSVGSNTIPVVVTAPNGATIKTYTLTVTRAPSSNADLSVLSINGGTLDPAFGAATTSYAVNVGNETTSVTVTPTAADSGAAVTVSGAAVSSGNASSPISLSVGSNTIPVVVTAQDGTTMKTYTITVTRAPSHDAFLNDLSVNGWELSPAFSRNTTAYAITVGSSTDTIEVNADRSESNARIEIDGIESLTGWANIYLDGTPDPEEITITVTAQDGTTSMTYTITVVKSSALSDALLSDLWFNFHDDDEINNAWLTPTGTVDGGESNNNGFIPAHFTYKCGSVGREYLAVTPVAGSASAAGIRITFRDADGGEIASEAVTSGSETADVSTEVLKTVEIRVTAGDGSTKTYTVVLTTSFLSGLSVSDGILTPAFKASTTSYAVSVENSVEVITISATTADDGATIDGVGEWGLDTGDNMIPITLTGSDSVVRTYTLIVTRAAPDSLGQRGFMTGDGNTAPQLGEIPPDLFTVEVDTRIIGGMIEANVMAAAAGMTVTLIIIPEDGWQLKDGTLKYYDGTEEYDITENSFIMPEADVTVTAEFEQISSDDDDCDELPISSDDDVCDELPEDSSREANP